MTVDGGGTDLSRPRRTRRRNRRLSIIGVIGELLITASVLVLLFLGWQLWLQDILVGNQLNNQAQKLGQTWQNETRARPAPISTPAPVVPVVSQAPGNAQKFGILIVPRWGKDWERPIAQGVGVADVLDAIGVGHYPGTQMPGQVGNFAIAAHRHAYGGGFEYVHELHVGDHVFVETTAGWYQYSFRDIQYVQPTQVNVLQPVPMEPGVKPTDRIITMTTCNPFFSTAERMVAYGLFDQFYPRAGGPPEEIAATVEAKG
ncbi:MAG: class sortase [Glaciihabitans sp.]|nr:class sortase [Glaciihabitans sp.]